jgi:signal transduction histidine kinase/ActR/RegA family two-component response regulator
MGNPTLSLTPQQMTRTDLKSKANNDKPPHGGVPQAFFGSFGCRLYIFLLLVVIPALVITLHEDFNEQRLEKARLRDEALALSGLAAANQESLVVNTRQVLATLGRFPLLLSSSNRSFCETQLSDLRNALPDYSNFGLVETNGELFCSAQPWTNTVYLGDRAWFQQAARTKQFSVGDFQISRLTKEPVVSFAYPVLDEHGALARILYASLDLSRLSQTIERIQVPDRGSIAVLDRNGLVLARHPYHKTEVGKPVLDPTTIRAILAKRGGAFETEGVDHISRFYAIKPVACGDAPAFFIAVEVPLAILFARANELLFGRILLLAAVASGILIVVRHYAKRFLLSPVKALAAVAQRLAGGDLAARAGAIGGARELRQLGGVLDAMADRVQARTDELIHTNDTLRTEIAERKRAEEEVRQQKEEKRKLEEHILRSQRMEGIGALAGGIAHDLNNALVPIVVGSHMLQQGGDNYADRQQVLETIESSGRRCTALLKQMLTFARGSREENSSVPLRHLIQEMAAIARGTFPKNIEVQRHFPKDLWHVQGNATELHQILLNLCVNARDAMPRGGLLVITAENRVLSEPRPSGASAGSYVAITVTDTGIGMPPEVRSRLFEPFFTTKAPSMGTGLGLSTVASIVKRHNGFLEVKSEVGQGAEFKIFIPAAPAVEPQNPLDTSSVPFGHGELILFVDDEKSILEIGKAALENYGYGVVTAENGHEAIAAFELHRGQISLIVMDTDMPYLDGVSAFQAIRKTGAQVPVILASAASPETTYFTRAELTHVEKLFKPYGIPDLLQSVANVLRGAPEEPTNLSRGAGGFVVHSKG